MVRARARARANPAPAGRGSVGHRARVLMRGGVSPPGLRFSLWGDGNRKGETFIYTGRNSIKGVNRE